MRSQNNSGQFTKGVSILITKELQTLANDVEVRVKPIVRDKLEETYKQNVYASYSPISTKGKEIKSYNEKHKYKKTQPYHHTGIFANSVKAIIDGNTVKAVIEDNTYPDGTSTTQLYEWLTQGTTKNPKSKSYSYDNGEKWSAYISTPKHLFEQHTLNEMEGFLESLASDLKNNPKKYHKKYYKKR